MKRRPLFALLLLALPSIAALSSRGDSAAAEEPLDGKADLVLVFKSERRLELRSEGRTLRTYRIALGGEPVGHKIQEGDGRTPEGLYQLDWRNSSSQFYKSIHISYPSDLDSDRAVGMGVEPGGMIMIHGLPNDYQPGRTDSYFARDWTNGCIAVRNDEMEEIWHAVDDGTPIMIFR